MGLPTQTILDSTGTVRTVNTLASGRQAAVDSAGFVLSAEDFAALSGIVSKLNAGINVTVTGGQLGETLWTNDAGVFRVRVDAGGTVTFVDPGTGTVDSSFAASAGFRPSGDAATTVKDSFVATTAGTGYAVGDLLDHILRFDSKTAALIGNYWLNSTQGTVLSSPPSGANIIAIGTGALPLSANASTETTLAALLTAVAATNSLLGQPATNLPPTPLLGSTAAPTDLTGARINITTATTTVLVAGTAGLRTSIHRMRFKIASNAATGGTIDLYDGPVATGTLLERYELGIGEGIFLDFCERPHFRGTAGFDINLVTSAAVSVQGRISTAQAA